MRTANLEVLNVFCILVAIFMNKIKSREIEIKECPYITDNLCRVSFAFTACAYQECSMKRIHGLLDMSIKPLYGIYGAR